MGQIPPSISTPEIVNQPNVPHIPIHIVGGPGGGYVNCSKYDQGLVIQGIDIWDHDGIVRGIEFELSDGSKMSMLDIPPNKRKHVNNFKMDIKSGERIIYLAISSRQTKWGQRCAGLVIKTNKGADFRSPSMQFASLCEIPVGGGIILGAVGRRGLDIDALGFKMIKPINLSEIVDFEYDLSRLGDPQKVSVEDITIPNPSNADNDSGYREIQETETTKNEWSWSESFEFGQKIVVKAGAPFIGGDITTETHWTVSNSSYRAKSEEKKIVLTKRVPLIVPARTKMRIFYYYYKSALNQVPYTATMRYELNDGDVWQFSVKGMYDGVSVSKIVGDSHLVARWINDRWQPVN